MDMVVLGLDLGTSGLKAVALGEDGHLVAEAEADGSVKTPRDNWAETDPTDWVAALSQVLAQLAPRLNNHRVAAVGVDGQMHGVVLVDAHGAPTRAAVLWPDRRAEEQTARWQQLSADHRARLANPISAGMAGPILAWLHQHEPSTMASSTHALQPKDYLRTVLGGPPVTDRSDASATLLWDVAADDWAHDVVEEVGIAARLLPTVRRSDEVVTCGPVPPGLGQGEVAVVTGAADTPAALLACGGLQPGEVQVNLGTGAQVAVGLERPILDPDPRIHMFADTTSGWYGLAAVQNAGLALGRARGWLAMTWEELFANASSCEPGAGGVSVLPFLTGERPGIASPTSRGAWIGLQAGTTREQLARAAVEAMVFTVRHAVELIGAGGQPVRLTGGAVRQRLVPQLLADVLASPVHIVTLRSPSAVGAALLATRGIDLKIPTVYRSPTEAVEPRPATGLDEAYARWADRLSVADR